MLKHKWIIILLLITINPQAKCPDRYVSVGGAITEFLVDLGQEDCMVAIDMASKLPNKEVPSIGYHRAIQTEGILSMKPDLVFYRDDAGPKSTIKQLQSFDIKLQPIPVAYEVEAIKSNIRTLAQVTSAKVDVEEYIRQFENKILTAQKQGHQKAKESAIFIYARGGNTILVAGKNTAGTSMLQLSSLKNPVPFSGYKPISTEAMIGYQPNYLIFTDSGLKSLGGLRGLQKHPSFMLLDAVKSGRVIPIAESLMLSFGPRLGEAIATLKAKVSSYGE